MKKAFNIKNLTLLLLSSLLVGCEINDPIDNVVRVGQQAPHVYWELPSNSVKAGSPVSFTAQYYAVGDAKIDHLEVWYDVNENIQTLVTCPLVTSFKYSVVTNNTSLSREYQKVATYNHSEMLWNTKKKAYQLDAVFNTSNTLRTVEWKEVKAFDEEKFNALFTNKFATQFKDSLYKLMKVADFRKVMVSLGVMTGTEFIAFTDSTFNQNSRVWDYFVKEDKKPELKVKYDAIQFKDLILDPVDQIYKIEYAKSYKLNARFKAFDEKQVFGVSDKKEIELR